MNLLKDIQAQTNVAYLLVAHDLATVRHMADDTAVMYLGKIVEYGPTERLFANVAHPYTKALFSAVLPPRPNEREPGEREEEIVLAGEVPSPLNPPSGCRFHTRCPFAMESCARQEPPLIEIAPGHVAACHLHTGAADPGAVIGYPDESASLGSEAMVPAR
jgi:oligopeptide/dipeptide ABC transporter ATP-binding protein